MDGAGQRPHRSRDGGRSRSTLDGHRGPALQPLRQADPRGCRKSGRANASSGPVQHPLVRGFQEVSGAVFEMSQNRFQKNVEALTALSRCRSVPEFLAAQTSLVRDNADLTLENSQQLTQVAVGVVEEMSRTVTVQASKADRPSRTA